MFKKLKEKVIDSQTSQRFQQITQSVSDKFQNLDKDENLFSLTEDDNAISSPTSTQMDAGFSNVSLTSTSQDNTRSRRMSNSSMTSDTSFLPRYDSVNSIYHLQSDLDFSASELEDNVSTASSQIGHLSKEQIYSAFQKSQMRYHKYRGRFTDLSNHYKNLEREFLKLKTELEKTQERSFRRVKELKEQCELEQKAKAHLESSLRVELDEKQIHINTLKEKISFLHNNSSTIDPDLTKNLNEAKLEIENLNSANQEMKAKLIVFQSKEFEYKEKIKKLGEDLEKLKETEKENNLKLAHSKMHIHNELLNKEIEMNNLKQENDNLKRNLDVYESKSSGNTKIEQLHNQNKNLIEKLENLSQKYQTLNNEVLKVEQYKIEIQNLKTKINQEKTAHDNEIIEITKEMEGIKQKLLKEKQEKEEIIDNLEKLLFNNRETYEKEIKDLKNKIEVIQKECGNTKKTSEDQIDQIREDAKKGLLSIEEKIKRKYEVEFKEKEDKLKIQLEERFQTLNFREQGAKDLHIKLLKYEDQLKTYDEEKKMLTKDLHEKTDKYNELERNYLELNKELTLEKSNIGKLEKKLQSLEGVEEKISRLQANISTLQQENAVLNASLEEQKENLEKLDELSEDNSKKVKIEAEEEYKILHAKIEDLEKERNQIMHELDALKEEFEKLSDYNSYDKKKIDEYMQKNEEIIEENRKREEKYKNEYDILLKEKNVVQTSLVKIKEELAIANMKLGNKGLRLQENKIIELKLHETEENYQEQLKQNEILIQENMDLRRTLEKTKNELESSTLNNKKLQNILDKFKEMEKEYEETMKSREEKTLENVELNEMLKVTKMQLENLQLDKQEIKMLNLKLNEIEEKYKEQRKLTEEKIQENLELHRTTEALNKQIAECQFNKLKEEEFEKLVHEKENLSKLSNDLLEKLKIAAMKLENEECDKNECKMLEFKLKELRNKYEELFQKNELTIAKNFNLEKTLSDIKIKLEKTEESLRNRERELDQIKAANENLKQKFSDRENQLQNVIDVLTEKEKKSNELLEEKNIDIKELTNQIQVKVQYIMNLEENYKVVDKKEKDLKKELEKYKTETDLKSKDLVKLENNFAEIQKLYSTEKKDIMKQLNNLKQVEKNYYSLLDENENLKEQISEIALLQEKLKSLSNIEVEKIDLEQRIKLLENEIKILKDENSEGKKKLSNFENFNEEFDKLKVERQNLLEELNKWKKVSEEKFEVENKLSKVENMLGEVEEKYKSLQEKYQTIKNITKSEKDEYNSKYSDLEVKYEQLLAEKNKLLEQLSMLEKEKFGLSEELKKNLEETANKKKQYEALKNEKEELFSKMLRVELTKKELESMCELNDKEKNELIEEISELRETINEINKEKQNLEKSCTNISDMNNRLNSLSLELEEANSNLKELKEENEFLKLNNKQINSDFNDISEENSKLLGDLEELKLNIENCSIVKVKLEEKEINMQKEIVELDTKLQKTAEELDTLKKENQELRDMKMQKVNNEVDYLDLEQNFYEIKTKSDDLSIENKQLRNQLEELVKNIENFKAERRKYENDIKELERHQNELLNEKQLLKEEIEELKISPINLNNLKKTENSKQKNGLEDLSNLEMDGMIEKLTQLKSLDITNKATIEFYESEVQKLKNNNEKLNRRLDETLVTLNHCSELSHSTELEYLRNVLYNYMLGKEGMVLARVIATVCKFDDEQTEEILKREQQKQTLLSKLGLL